MLTPTSANPVAPPKGVLVEIMTELSLIEALSFVLALSPGITQHTLYLRVNATVAGTELSAGAVQPETNSDVAATGGWAPVGGGPVDLTTVNVPAAQLTGEVIVNFSGIYNAFRCRLTTAAVGGTVSIRYMGTN